MTELLTERIPLAQVAEYIDPSQPRTDKYPHLSEMVHQVLQMSGKGYPDRGEEIEPRVEDIMSAGRIWEGVSRPFLEGKAKELKTGIEFNHPIFKDGIVGTIDGLFRGGEEALIPPTLIETKLRFKKPHDPREYERYMMQVKSYCHMLGISHAVMPILFLETRPPAATLIMNWLSFTEQELGENWMAIKNMAEYQAKNLLN